jgi:undecaprenyl diphosphate synthase
VGVYDRYLALRVRRSAAPMPEHVAVAVTERDLLEQGAYATLESMLGWAFEYDAERVTVYVSVLDPAAVPTLRRELTAIDAPREMAVRGPDDTERADAPVQVSIGHGGREEFAEAVRSLAVEVDGGELAPGDIEPGDIEERLVFPAEPDLFIKTGAERLSDFMIWQSVYSELYFTDVNWRDFRLRDYLRAVREFQDRQRRFGR